MGGVHRYDWVAQLKLVIILEVYVQVLLISNFRKWVEVKYEQRAFRSTLRAQIL